MPVPALNPFPLDALEANRRGELSEEQRRGFGALSGSRRRSALSSAAFLVAGALLVLFFASPTSSPVLRAALPVACLAIAAFLVVRSIAGGDALTRDLREGRVESVEGAIGKSRGGGGGGRSVTTHFLEVGDRIFKVTPAPYREAPDAGLVRLYFLPRSRKVVNLERLPSAPVPDEEVTPRGVVASLGTALFASGRRERNEARAGIAALADALAAGFSQTPPAAPPPQARDPRPLARAVLGTWSNGMMKVTFTADGRVSTHMPGMERSGRWSVDATGRLRSDITGHEQTADAWVAGDRLTIAAEAGALTFTRESGA
jgi:hypothetical protein